MNVVNRTEQIRDFERAQAQALARADPDVATRFATRCVRLHLPALARPHVRLARRCRDPSLQRAYLKALLDAEVGAEARTILAFIDAEDVELIPLLLRAGMVDRAVQLAGRLQERSAEAAHWRARFALWSGEGLRLSPTLSQHQTQVLRASQALAERRFQDASRLAESVVREDASNGEAWAIHGEALARAGASGAEDALARGQRLMPEAHFAIRLSQLLLRMRRPNRRELQEVSLDLTEIGALCSAAMGETLDQKPTVGRSHSKIMARIEHILSAMGANRSPVSTVWSAARLRPLPQRASIRARSVRPASAYRAAPTDAIHHRFVSLRERWGNHPTLWTYEAEVWMWDGAYARAEGCLRRALGASERTRWAYSGLPLALALLGRAQEGMAIMKRGARLLPPLDAALVYRAEMHLRQGAVRMAHRLSARAMVVHPHRISAILIHGICQRLLAQETAPLRARIQEQAPLFWEHWQAEAGARPGRERWWHGLKMLRGSRSSGALHWFTREGDQWIQWMPVMVDERPPLSPWTIRKARLLDWLQPIAIGSGAQGG
ncbi:MAG: hypothetical protein AAFV53_25390 [Myxococcota bacterium]